MTCHRRGGILAFLACLVLLLVLPAIRPACAQGTATGSQYVTFWQGTLRVIATQPNTQVGLIDVTYGGPLSQPFNSNFGQVSTFVLANAGDSFEGTTDTTYWVRIIAKVASGPNAGDDAPIIVFTGDINSGLVHPGGVSTDVNAWLSYLPAFSPASVENGTEIGRDFWGFTSRELYVFAPKKATPTRVQIEDRITNVETDSDDSTTLTSASPALVYEDADVEIYYLDQFEDDTLRITSDTDVAVLAGIASQGSHDFTITPPSFGAGEDFRELGTLFYTYVARDLTVFPTQDDTTVTITDLSDGDDTITFNLAGGDLNGDYDLFVTDLTARSGTGVAPRGSNPVVRLSTLGSSAPFDNDFVKVEADKPVLLYVGPKSSDTFEYADVAYSLQTGPREHMVYVYAQNGGARDLQLFVFRFGTNVQITSLTRTLGFQTQAHHDWLLPNPTPYLAGNLIYNDFVWADDSWDGELLRITSDGPLTVMGGDYDSPNFGSFLPFVASSPTLKPIADAGPDVQQCPGDRTVTLDGSDSFDTDNTNGTQTPTWTWDVDAFTDADGDGDFTNDIDASGQTVDYTFPADGVWIVTLTYTDDDGQTDTDVVVIRIEDNAAPEFVCPSDVTIGTGVDDTDCATPFDQNPSAPDTCGGTVTVTSDAPAVYPLGTTTVTWTAADDSGNETSCTQEVTVVDTTPPAIDCPARLDAVPDTPDSAFVAVNATASDNCDASVPLQNDRTAGGADASDDYPCGGTFVTFSSPDAGGNVGTCITVVAVAPPVDPVDPGNTLRLGKEPSDPTVVHLSWTDAPARSTWESYSVRRSQNVRIQPFPVLAAGPGMTTPSYTDGDATGAYLLFYEVRTRDCTGAVSPDPYP